MTPANLDRGLPAAVREFRLLAGPDRRLMARLDAITDATKSDMGPARYAKLNEEWKDGCE